MESLPRAVRASDIAWDVPVIDGGSAGCTVAPLLTEGSA